MNIRENKRVNTKELRVCPKCYQASEVYYHTFKNNTQHLVMLCPNHGYIGLPYEHGLDLTEYVSKNKKFKEPSTAQIRKMFKDAEEYRFHLLDLLDTDKYE